MVITDTGWRRMVPASAEIRCRCGLDYQNVCEDCINPEWRCRLCAALPWARRMGLVFWLTVAAWLIWRLA